MKKWHYFIASIFTLTLFASPSMASDYAIDIKGQHAFINFKISHLGYSWLTGSFNKFDGSFVYDNKNPNQSSVNVVIDTASIDSNHAARDKHLRSDDFLNVKEYPQATFVSTNYTQNQDGSGTLVGDLTLLGVTKAITIDTQKVGEGDDPWGGYRAGFEGETSFKLADFGIKKDLGTASAVVYLELHIEGIRQ